MQTEKFCAVIANSGRGSVTVGELGHIESVIMESDSYDIVDG